MIFVSIFIMQIDLFCIHNQKILQNKPIVVFEHDGHFAIAQLSEQGVHYVNCRPPNRATPPEIKQVLDLLN
jgi:hypothetical protein